MKNFLLLIAALIFVGCAPRGDVSLEGVDDVKLSGINAAGVTLAADLTIRNDFPIKIKVSSVEVEVLSSGRKIADATLTSPVVLPPRAVSEHSVTFDVTFAQGAMLTIMAGGLHDVVLRGRAKAMNRTIDFEHQLSEEEVKSLF